MSYAEKLGGFVGMCIDAKSMGADVILITHPSVLGDTYVEVIQSLSLLAEQKFSLTIAVPQPGYPPLAELHRMEAE
jgi:hypothetical protein